MSKMFGYLAPRVAAWNLFQFCQRDPRWGGLKYSSVGSLTHAQAGCLVNSISAGIVNLTGLDFNPQKTGEELSRAGAFVGDNLNHPSKVERAFPLLRWHYDKFLGGKESSFVNWEGRPADLEILKQALEIGLVAVKVDFQPQTVPVDQHFVLGVAYTQNDDGDDDLIVMDPWYGCLTSVKVYFNPRWKLAKGTSVVSRALMGLRVWEVVG